MRDPLVTLSLPTIGRLEFFGALKSAIQSQTFEDFEVIVADNACPPDARAQLADWAREDKRVRHLPIDERIPMFPNFNRGFMNARGKYYVSMNDDDLYKPRFLEKMVAMLDREPNVGFVGSNYDYIDEMGKVTEERRWLRADEVCRGRDYILRLMRAGRNPIAMSGIMLRKAAMDPRGFADDLSPYYGDFVLLMRIAENHHVGFLTDSLMQIRRHSDQASLRFNHAKGYVLRTVTLRSYLGELRERFPNDDAFHHRIQRAFEHSNRKVSLWGWLTAPDEDAARECLGVIGDKTIDAALQAALARAPRVGLDARMRHRIAPLVRRVANALRG